MPNYYLVAVSNRHNLELCLRYALAGFTDSVNGLWAFLDIQENDYLSFLYGAKVYNLYQVNRKEAFREADKLPPWPPVTFRRSGKTYYFPFRLQLHPVREFQESVVRWEFAYVAENLLLRGGYGKTQFQADRTTLQVVSQMGSPFSGSVEALVVAGSQVFTPRVAFARTSASPPEVYSFREVVLQALIKHYFANTQNLREVLSAFTPDSFNAAELELLGERALPEGHIDILIKEANPVGTSRNVIIEVKVGKASLNDTRQLKGYVEGVGPECQGGLLIAREFARNAQHEARQAGLVCVVYSFESLDQSAKHTFAELLQDLRLTILS